MYCMMNIDRRTLITRLLQAAVASSLGKAGVTTGAAQRLRYLCWEGYDSPTLAAPFEAAEGARLEYELISDSSYGFAKLQAGGDRAFDLVSIDLPWMRRLGSAGLCQSLQPEAFSRVIDDFYPVFSPISHQQQVIGLPTRWGWIGPTLNLQYSTEKEFSSYAPCFDRRNRGRIGVIDWGDWPILPLALYAGIDPYQPLDGAALAELARVFRALLRNEPVFVSDVALAQKALLDGSVKTFLGTGTYATSALRRAGFEQIRTIVPEPRHGLAQGIIWVEATAVIAGSPVARLGERFLNYLLSPQGALALSLGRATCNLTPSRAVEALYTAEQRRVLQLDYAWDAWSRSRVHDRVPDIGSMLEVWQRELIKAG